MSKPFKITIVLSLSFFLILIFVLIRHGSKEKVYLWIEAENADRMEFPVEIFPDKECSNGKGITIREGAGVGFLGAPGSADYSFHIPKKGEYTIWFRVRWEDGCANSFYASIDHHDYPINNEDLTHSVGNQNNYHHWFWIPGTTMSLDKGTHTIRIRNREDGIELDKILITNDADTRPEGFNKLSFILRDFKGAKLIQKGENYPYQDFYAEADLADLKLSSVFTLLFSYQDDRNFNELTLKEDRLFVSRVSDGKRLEISSKEVSGLPKDSAHLSCYFLQGQLSIEINGKEVLFLEHLENKEGSVGFFLRGASLKWIQVIPLVPIYRYDNFYDSAWNFSANPLDWKEMSLPEAWFAPVEEGFPYQYQIAETSQTSETAITITGEKWWRNYQYEVYVKGNAREGFALLFYYTDENHYYALWCKPAEQTISLFSKNEGTSNEIYRTSSENYLPDQWNKFQIQIFEGNIKILLNEKEIGTVQDRSLTSGMTGLAAKGAGKVFFDEVSVQSLSGQNRLAEVPKTDSSTIATSDLFDFIESENKDADDMALNQLSKLLFGEDLAPIKKRLAFLVKWHIASGDWQLKDHMLFCSASQAISLIWSKHAFFGRLRIDFDFILEKDTSELSFGLYDEDREISKAIRLTPAKISLLNNLKEEEETLQGKIKAGQKHHAQIEIGQDGIKIRIDSEMIGRSDFETNPVRLRPFFWTKSGKVDMDNFTVRTFPEHQYTFSVLTNAVEDFYDWQKDCTGWSISFADLFKGLRGRIENGQDILIWNRRSFSQNQIAIELSSRIYSRGILTNDPFRYERGIIFCSNGSAKNGYAVRVSLSDIQLFRNGEKVASSPVRDMDLWNWNALKVKKDHDVIRIYITDAFGHDRLGLEYQDEQPLTDDRIGLELSGPDGLQVIFKPVRIYINQNESS